MHIFKYKRTMCKMIISLNLRTCRQSKIGDDGAVLSLNVTILKVFFCRAEIESNITAQDELEELAVTLCDKLLKAVDTSTPKVYSRSDPKSPISQAPPLTGCRKKLGPKYIKNRLSAGKNSATPLA